MRSFFQDVPNPYSDNTTSLLQQNGDQSLANISELAVGYGNKAMYVDKQGLWLGNTSFGSAPFSVDMNGNAVFNSVIIGGYIPVGGAAADVNSNVTTISGGQITTNSITASKLNVSQLSAIAADLGTITAGSITGITITGGIIRTAASGARFELNNSGSKASAYSSGGIELVRLDGTGLGCFGTNSLYFGPNSSSTKGIIYYDGSSSFNMGANSGTKIGIVTTDSDIDIVAGSGGAIVVTASGDVQLSPKSGSAVQVSSGMNLGADLGMNNHNMNGVNQIFVSTVNAGAINGTSLSISGSKSAIIETNTGWRKVYSAEAPEVWLFDFTRNKYQIDPIFLEMTEGESYFVDFYDEKGDTIYQVWRHRKGFLQTRLEKVNEEEKVLQ